MLRFIFVILLIEVSVASAYAQTDSTTHLHEVMVYGIPLTRFTPGSKVQSIQQDFGETLTDALGRNSPLYFKTYGNGQLATVSFRGTSASHTAVMWNGINVNSPTLGQTDFSLWPVFLMEEVSLQYGAGSALYGTDAIGGSVLINQALPSFNKKPRFEYRQEMGSFGQWLSGAKAVYGNDKLEFRTKAYYRFLENDFPYTSPKVGTEKKQNDASVENYGFDQQVHWKISDSKLLSVQGQYVYNFREVQPAVTNNNSGDVLLDKNTRVSVSYHQDMRYGNLFGTIAYVLNDELYNRQSRTRSDQITGLLQYDIMLKAKTNFRVGGNWTKYFTTSDGFDGKIREDRYDAFASVRHAITSFWTTSINLRQSFYARHTAPFAPSWGNQFNVLKNKRSSVAIRTLMARSYRVPTLNDRYWSPGGNPDLKSETGFSAEAGMDFIHKTQRHEIKFEGTYHRQWIDEWIIWLPNTSGLYSPSNLTKVNVRGVETSLNYTYQHSELKLSAGASYAFTRSINKKGLNEFDDTTPGKQLPYVPLHSGHAFVKAIQRTWTIGVQLDYTGMRYTSLDNLAYQALPAYALLSASVGKEFDLSWSRLSLGLNANNLLGTYYENIENHAMPGRNYMLNLTFKF